MRPLAWLLEQIRGPNSFALLILTLYLGAMVRYMIAREYGRAMYWVCAFGITTSATWLMGWKK